jgi:hypothetical protein
MPIRIAGSQRRVAWHQFEPLIDLFSGLIKAALEITFGGRSGVEEASAAVTTLFLNGTRRLALRMGSVGDPVSRLRILL